jgi:DNA repair exonuclease SbcCD ATPase subunit
MIVFKQLKWKNFLSTGDAWTTIELRRSKSTLIVGENGAGKSTMLDALSFALYGKAFRKINKSQLINTINSKNTIVEVAFQIGKHDYLIKRGIKPSMFEIWQNGRMINQDAAARDYQEMLEKQILKLNHKSFSQIVVLGSSTFVPFMQLSSMNRREVIEDLLDLQIFSIMNSLLKERLNENKSNIIEVDYQINLHEEKISMQEQYISSIAANSTERINEGKDKIAAAEKTIKTHEDTITNLRAQIEDLNNTIQDEEKVSAKKIKLQKLEFAIERKIADLKKEIKFYEDNDNCPTCKQSIDEDFKCNHLDDRKNVFKETSDGYDQLRQEFNDTVARMGEILETQNQINLLENNVNTEVSEVNALNRIINTIQSDINKIENDNTSTDKEQKQLEKYKKGLEVSALTKNDLSNKKAILEVASMLLKDSGIKTRIIRQYIPVMNKLINKYLAAMDFFVQFELDESFNETIRSRYRDEFSYASFSEGEKMRIDLALLFTWRAIAKIRNSASTNLLIMDEVFDSSLDNAGTEEFLKILNDLTADTNIFIISHKGDQLYDKFHSVIRFEKVKNFSRIAA